MVKGVLIDLSGTIHIGKQPVPIPDKVKVDVKDHSIQVEGPKGKTSFPYNAKMKIQVDKGEVLVIRPDDSTQARSLHGLTRTLVANMVTGVSAGFTKGLEISGVGFRAELAGTTLKLFVGYSVPSVYEVPEGVAVKIEKLINLTVSGIDKELVGRVAAEGKPQGLGDRLSFPGRGHGHFPGVALHAAHRFAGRGEIERRPGRSTAPSAVRTAREGPGLSFFKGQGEHGLGQVGRHLEGETALGIGGRLSRFGHFPGNLLDRFLHLIRRPSIHRFR